MSNTKEDNRLFLLDAYALIFRAYYSMGKNFLYNSKGFNVTAVMGFTRTLHTLIKKQNPTHIAVVFDFKSATFRSEEFEYYKANRAETPEDIKLSEPIIREIIKAFDIPILEVKGYEADDVIGTLAKREAKNGHKVYMVTPDKDFAQLVEDNIFIYKPGRKGGKDEILGVPEIQEKWEVETPDQVIDILAMWGDAVDNIPGIPGVGEKTAKKFIKAYGSLEGLYENTDKLKGKQKEKVEANKQQAFDSKKLATIITDVPIEVTEEELTIGDIDKEKLTEIFSDMEFKTLGRDIIGDSYKVTPKKQATDQLDLFGSATAATEEIAASSSFETSNKNYQLVQSETEINELITQLKQAKSFAFDTETTGLNSLTAEIVGISFSAEENTGYYMPISENQAEATKQLSVFKPIFLDDKTEKIGQNIKYDIKILNRYGITVNGPLYDTMLAHYLIEPDYKHNMDFLSETYLGYSPISIETLIGKKGKNQKSMRDVELEKITQYASEDADITFQLKQKLNPLVKQEEASSLLANLEMPLVPVLAKMEQTGIALDSGFLNNYSSELGKELLGITEKVYELAGMHFNLNSPKQLGEVLFDKLKIPYKGKKTSTGQYSTNEETLLNLKGDNEIVDYILDYREIAKLKSTYIDALPALVNPNTNRIHTSFNQAVASTGRLSSDKPNLQNIPIRTERGRKIRQAFVPQNDDFTLLAADYSQVELRLVAHLSNDQVMIDAFNHGKDIHRITAAKVFGVTEEEVTREMRSHAKVVNFGIIYGVSAFGLARQTNLSRSQSKEIIENYYATYAGVKAYMDTQIKQAQETGFVETIMGRRRKLRDINSRNFGLRGHAERNAINAPVQGSAADMIKVAMINIDKAMVKANLKSKMLLQVHDELVFEAYKPELDELKHLVKTEMEQAIPNLKVPIITEMGTGNNWLEAH